MAGDTGSPTPDLRGSKLTQTVAAFCGFFSSILANYDFEINSAD